MTAIKQHSPWVISLTLHRRIMCQRDVYCPVNPMLFPSVFSVRQSDFWHSMHMQLLSRGRDRRESGFQMFLGASAVGEPHRFCLRRRLSGGAQVFAHGADASIIIKFPFRENSVRTISFLSDAFCVRCFLKCTLVSCVKRNDGFSVLAGCQDPSPQPQLPPVSAGCCS